MAALAACNTILGTFEVEAPVTDAGTSDGNSPPDDGGAGADGAGQDGSTTVDAGTDSDVLDAGADGPPPVVPCKTDGDAGALVYPGDPCLFDALGNSIPSLGSCRPGKWACIDLGAGQRKASCIGAEGPKLEVCTADAGVPADENCDGTVDEGCACTLGATRACGVGECRIGALQTCVAQDGGAGWGPCVGPAPKPRRCNSPLDNNCNGVPDEDETFCKCAAPGGQFTVDPGKTAVCANFGSGGACAGVKRTCVVSTDKTRADWDLRCFSGKLSCADQEDNDCQNGPDYKERDCNVCKDGSGAAVPPRQTFTPQLIGCGGAVAANNAGALCASTCKVASAKDWLASSGTAVPQSHYWTDDSNFRLYTAASAQLPCLVESAGQDIKYYTACPAGTPARVCAPISPGNKDAYGNYCAPTCAAARFMGGCASANTPTGSTAGAICVCP